MSLVNARRTAFVEPGNATMSVPPATPATARESIAAAPTSCQESMRKSSPNPSIRDTLSFSGHRVVDYRVVADVPEQIREVLSEWIERDDVQAVLSNGGTGIAARDTTYDAISGMLEKRIDGFGELFRMLSWQEVGAAAMLSRAVAGVAGGTLIVAMPGSTNAVRLALTKLIVPELGHLVYEITK